jgi:uncharacterized membrane protein YhaH (DUF805 family)
MDFKWLLFSFEGRLNRAPYWGVLLVMSLLGMGLGFAIYDLRVWQPLTTSPTILETLWLLFACWIVLAVQVKRWHDRDKSGWWALINLVPLVGGIWVLIECGFLRGTAGRNRFGADPLAVPAQSARPPSGPGAV